MPNSEGDIMRGCEKEKSEIKRLKRLIKRLRDHLTAVKGFKKTVDGTEGEKFILRLIRGGIKKADFSPHDLVTRKGNRIEVKNAQPVCTNNKIATPCYRWNWRYVLRPNKKRKYYDYLILMGKKDKRYKQNDLDKTPYVYFILSFEETKRIVSPKDDYGQISLTTNLDTVRGKQGKTLLKYRKSFSELKAILKKI